MRRSSSDPVVGRSLRRWSVGTPSALAAALLLIMVAAIAIRLPLLLGGELDYDEGVYWESLRAMHAGHPLFSAIYSSQPPAFLLSLWPFFALGHSLVAARTGVLFFSLLGMAATFQLVRVLAGWPTGLVAAAIMAVDPLALRESVTLQADAPSVALGTVAVALAATAGVRPTRAATICRVLAGLVLGGAICTKLLAVAFLPPIVLLLCRPSATDSSGTAPRASRAARLSSLLVQARLAMLQLVGGLAVSMAAILAPFADRWPALWKQVVSLHWGSRSLTVGGPGGNALLRELPLAALAAVGFIAALRSDRRNAILIACWAVSVAAVLESVHPLWTHDVVVAIPLLATAASLALISIAQQALPIARAALAAVAVVAMANVFLIDRSSLHTVPNASRVLASSTTPTQLIVSDDPFAVASANRDTPPALVDTSRVRIDEHALSRRDIESAILKDRVRVVYWTGSLEAVAGLRAWVSHEFPRRRTLARGAVVFTR